jgi:hypothetical protein
VRPLILILVAGASLNGCSGPPLASESGSLEVTLSSPFPDDGALLFTVTGGRVDSVESLGYTVYSSRPEPNTLEVIVTGQLSSGTIARLYIANERLAPAYSARVIQAAARVSYSQRDPAAYGLTLAP